MGIFFSTAVAHINDPVFDITAEQVEAKLGSGSVSVSDLTVLLECIVEKQTGRTHMLETVQKQLQTLPRETAVQKLVEVAAFVTSHPKRDLMTHGCFTSLFAETYVNACSTDTLLEMAANGHLVFDVVARVIADLDKSFVAETVDVLSKLTEVVPVATWTPRMREDARQTIGGWWGMQNLQWIRLAAKSSAALQTHLFKSQELYLTLAKSDEEEDQVLFRSVL
jgi:hypothetical protein